jgi:hypothetical protein
MMIGGHGQAMYMEQLKRSREAAGKMELNVDISSGNQAFDEKLNNGFVAMMKALKERQKKEREQRPTMPTKVNPDSNSPSSIANETTEVSPAVGAVRISLYPQSTTPEMIRMINPYAKGNGPSAISTVLPHHCSQSTIKIHSTTPGLILCNTNVNPCLEYPNSINHPSSTPDSVSTDQGSALPSSQLDAPVMSLATNPYAKNPTTVSATKAPTIAKAFAAQCVKKNYRTDLRKDNVTASGPLMITNSLVEPAMTCQEVSPNTNNVEPVGKTMIESNGSWTCYVCTFHNKPKAMTRSKCEMCNSVRRTLLSGVTVSIDC